VRALRSAPGAALALLACLTVFAGFAAAAAVPAHAAAVPAPAAAGRAASQAVRAAHGLSAREHAAAIVLSRQRTLFLARFAAHPDRPFTTSFMALRRVLDASRLHRTLEQMPKGGMLHIHSTATGDAEWIIDRAFTEPGCFIYWGPASDKYFLGQLDFFPTGEVPAGWVAAGELEGSVPDLSSRLLRLYTMGPEDESQADPWKEFETIFTRIDGFVSYRPVFVDQYAHAFLRLARDGVQFVELRTSLSAVHAEDGSVIVDEGVLDLYRQALAAVRTRYPDFDLRLILSARRTGTLEQAADKLARQRRLAATAPDLLYGFDLIGQEDAGKSNAFFAPALSTLPQVPLLLHSGESLSPADTNVGEALELGAPRIGHGLNMGLFPGLEDEVRKAAVTIEVCPLSNQALRYVPDLRRHPARGWLRRGMRVVLGSDDPAIFGSTGLTDDLSVAYLSWGIGLRTLKRMALRSITASVLPQDRKERQRTIFELRWRRWVTAVAASGRVATR
jgi:adenosine deaminase CECR1